MIANHAENAVEVILVFVIPTEHDITARRDCLLKLCGGQRYEQISSPGA